jgi:ParB-like chromosome segregation protein Spo0J
MIEYKSTKEVPLSELAPFPGNARRGDVDAIAESITENGQYRSLIVRQSTEGALVVLAGNHTMAALAQLGRKTARVEIIACDDNTAKKINLVDNKLPDSGGYDDAALAALLGSLDDLDGTGYTPDDLDDLLALTNQVPEMPEQPTGARYAESPEEEQARRERVEGYEPRHGGEFTELILVMSLADRQEAAALIAQIRERDGDDLTAGQTVLYALRVHAADPKEDDDE